MEIIAILDIVFNLGLGGAYTISSLGYGYTNTSDNSRPSSGNYSDLKDNAMSDGINSTSNSTSPQSVGSSRERRLLKVKEEASIGIAMKISMIEVAISIKNL